MSGVLARLGARLIRASMLVDRAAVRFDQLRSLVITATASDAVLDAYNDLTYGASRVYDAGAPQFRTELFNWEAGMVDQVFPPPPGRVLVGGAGGGREAFALAARGYEVVAFEPSRSLARSMADRAAITAPPVVALLGRYEDLPALERADSGDAVDVSAGPRFVAALLGWTSYSHIRHRGDRVETLRQIAAITDGPVVASFYVRPATMSRHWAGRLAARLALRPEGDRFTPHIGYYHMTTREELAAVVAEAGLVIVAASYDDSDGYWPWIAAARPEIAAASSSPRS